MGPTNPSCLVINNSAFPWKIHLFKVNNRNTRQSEICSKLAIKTPEWRHFTSFCGVVVVDFVERVNIWGSSRCWYQLYDFNETGLSLQTSYLVKYLMNICDCSREGRVVWSVVWFVAQSSVLRILARTGKRWANHFLSCRVNFRNFAKMYGSLRQKNGIFKWLQRNGILSGLGTRERCRNW